jgi:hypothetical protein
MAWFKSYIQKLVQNSPQYLKFKLKFKNKKKRKIEKKNKKIGKPSPGPGSSPRPIFSVRLSTARRPNFSPSRHGLTHRSPHHSVCISGAGEITGSLALGAHMSGRFPAPIPKPTPTFLSRCPLDPQHQCRPPRNDLRQSLHDRRALAVKPGSEQLPCMRNFTTLTALSSNSPKPSWYSLWLRAKCRAQHLLFSRLIPMQRSFATPSIKRLKRWHL